MKADISVGGANEALQRDSGAQLLVGRGITVDFDIIGCNTGKSTSVAYRYDLDLTC